MVVHIALLKVDAYQYSWPMTKMRVPMCISRERERERETLRQKVLVHYTLQ